MWQRFCRTVLLAIKPTFFAYFCYLAGVWCNLHSLNTILPASWFHLFSFHFISFQSTFGIFPYQNIHSNPLNKAFSARNSAVTIWCASFTTMFLRIFLSSFALELATILYERLSCNFHTHTERLNVVLMRSPISLFTLLYLCCCSITVMMVMQHRIDLFIA